MLVIDSLEVGGAERHVVQLAVALQQRGYLVEVASAQTGPLQLELDAHRIPVHVLVGSSVKRRVSAPYAHALRRLTDRREFDLVHAHLFASTVAAALMLPQGVPLIVTEHSEGGWKGQAAVSATRSVHRRAARIIAVSSALAAGLDAPATVIRNAIPRPLSEGRWLRDGPQRTGRHLPTIGVLARLQPEKGVDLFIQAVAQLRAHRPEVRFVVAGDGPCRASLQQLARTLRVDESLTFAGQVDDVPALVGGFDILTVPSRTEGTPLVVLEGMQAGVPLVTSDLPGIAEQLRHGVDGILVPPHSPHQLASAWRYLLDDPRRGAALAASAGARVRREFDHDCMTSAVEAVYAEALSALRLRDVG